MAWTTELVDMLRYIINDIDVANYTWTDEQLQKFIGIAAIRVGSDLSQWGFPTFTFISSTTTLTPDPTDYDSIVGLLIVVKAACSISLSDLKKMAAQSGFTVVDDVSKIETKDMIKSAQQAVETFCGDYDDAIKAYKKGAAFSGARDALAILAPYANQEGDSINGY